MKLTHLVLVLALIQISSTAYGQITLKEKNAPPEKVLATIEKQTKFVFLYDPDDLKTITITIDIKNATIRETMEKCFKNTPIEFNIVGNNVLLKKKHPQNAGNEMTSPSTITGKVFDETGQPLQDVTVINKKEIGGALTDSNGSFTIPAAKGDILLFSFVGFKQQQIAIGEQHHIYITLATNPASPEQAVVIGYGDSKKKDLTGSVAVVNVKNMEAIPFNSVDNALAGRAAGVQVTKTDGTPGGMARIRVRGSSSFLGTNDPLYVIDGVPVQPRSNFIDPGYQVASPAANLAAVNGGALNGAGLSASFINGLNSLTALNPDDIESITVLKDASSTAIYGSKAANGVVIITTKGVPSTTIPRVTTEYYSSVNSPYRTPRMLNADEYRSLLKESAANGKLLDSLRGYPPDPLKTSILNDPSWFGNANTDWIKTITRTTVSQNLRVSVAGGGETTKFITSIGYNNTPGVVAGTSLRRITGKLGIESRITPRLKFSVNLLPSYTDQDLGAGAYFQAMLARPDLTPRDATGNFTDFSNEGPWYLGYLNPSALTTATNHATTTALLGSVSACYKISNDLSVRSTVSLNGQHYNQRNFLPSYIMLNTVTGNPNNQGAIGAEANSRFSDWFLENTISWSKRLGHHAATFVAGQSYESTRYSFFRATASGYPNNTTLTGLSSASTPLSTAGDDPKSPQSYLLSFYARANYSWMDKYLLTFTGRADGSSKFGPSNKWGYFPSGAIAWRLSKEPFLTNAKWIDDLKLRASYGLTGNQNIGDQMYRTLYTPVNSIAGRALIPTQLGNEGIKWESTRQTDLGLDIALLAGRLTGTLDYYNRQTNGALLSLPIASSTGYSQLLQNAAGLRNRGFEICIGGDIIRGSHFHWNASVNIAWNSSLVTHLDSMADLRQITSPSGLENIAGASTNYFGNTGLIEGKPLGLITGEFVTGIIRTQAELDDYKQRLGTYTRYLPPLQIGDPMFQLAPAGATYQGTATGVVIGTGAPKYFGGMTQEFGYKNFSLQCNFSFAAGGHLLWVEHAASVQFFSQANAGAAMLGRYWPGNTNANLPRLNFVGILSSNLDVFSSSYFKLRSIVLNYNFDYSQWMKSAAVQNLQVFISATNLFTITKYPGGDPETSDDPYSINGGYIDAGNYPSIKTFSFGLKTAF